MPTYQLRLVRPAALWDLLEELVSNMWNVCLAHAQCCPMDLSCHDDARQIIQKAFGKRLTHYYACGERDRCHSAVRPMKWSVPDTNDRWLRHSQTEHQAIVLFKTPASLESFVLDMEGKLFDRLCPKAPSHCWANLKEALDRSIRQTLAPYLFKNPFCEGCVFCFPRSPLERVHP